MTTKYTITYYAYGRTEEMESTLSPEDAQEMIVVGMNVGLIDAIHMMVTDDGEYVYHTEHVRTCPDLNTWITVTSTPCVTTLITTS